MNLDVSLSILLIFCTACYLLLGSRLIANKREIGSLPIGVLFMVVSIWVMGGAIELMSSTFELFFDRPHRPLRWNSAATGYRLRLLSRVHGPGHEALGNRGAYDRTGFVGRVGGKQRGPSVYVVTALC